MKGVIATLVMLTAVSGCDPKVGGPCHYAEFEVLAQVESVTSEYVIISNERVEHIPVDRFSAAPSAGDWVKVQGETIISGACTPLIIHQVEVSQFSEGGE